MAHHNHHCHSNNNLGETSFAPRTRVEMIRRTQTTTVVQLIWLMSMMVVIIKIIGFGNDDCDFQVIRFHLVSYFALLLIREETVAVLTRPARTCLQSFYVRFSRIVNWHLHHAKVSDWLVITTMVLEMEFVLVCIGYKSLLSSRDIGLIVSCESSHFEFALPREDQEDIFYI